MPDYGYHERPRPVGVIGQLVVFFAIFGPSVYGISLNMAPEEAG